MGQGWLTALTTIMLSMCMSSASILRGVSWATATMPTTSIEGEGLWKASPQWAVGQSYDLAFVVDRACCT